MKRLKLSTPTEVRRALTRVANMLMNGQIDPKTANAIIYTCNVVLASIKTQHGDIHNVEINKRSDKLDDIIRQLQQEPYEEIE